MTAAGRLRTTAGGRIDRTRELNFTFDGRPYRGLQGDTLASALLDHPALAGVRRRAIPPALTLCAGPFTAQAAVLLAR